ncbi:hypothetical protein J7L67_04165 [bacterium]|nr:hypothetical protein [bacterium]
MIRRFIVLITSVFFTIILNTVCYALTYAPANEMSGQPSVMVPDVEYSITANFYDTLGRDSLSSFYLTIEYTDDGTHATEPADPHTLVMFYRKSDGAHIVWAQDQPYVFFTNFTFDQPISHPQTGDEGYQVTFTFKLNSNWVASNYGIWFGIQAIGSSESGWSYDTSDAMFNGSANPKSKLRALWMWDQNNDLLDTIITTPDLTKRAEFFSFLSAPYGDSSKKIDTIYFNISPESLDLINEDDPQDSDSLALLRSFVADAHSKGFKIEALFGEASIAIYPDGGIGYLDWVYEFNKLARENEQYDGIHFDVEPHTIKSDMEIPDPNNPSHNLDWNTDRDYIWGKYISSMTAFAAEVQEHNSNETKNSIFGASINKDYDQWFTSPPGNEQVQGITGLDYVAVMNYWTRNRTPTDSINEIVYADSIGKDVYIGYETKDLNNDNTSFWNWGNDALEACIDATDLRYGNQDVPSDNYASYKGIAIHEYSFTDPDTGAVSGYKNFPITSNKAPVAFVLDPSVDGIAVENPYSSSYTIQYAVYDDDTTTLTVNVYILRNGTQIGDSIYTATHSVTPSNPLIDNTFTYTFNSTDHPEGGGYKIKIVVTDTGGLTGTDESDFEFHLGTGLILYYSFDTDNGVNVLDESSYDGSHNGQVVGSASYVSGTPTDIDGPVAKGTGAFEFSGGVVSLPAGDLHTRNPTAGLTRFTLTMWFKTANPTNNYKLASAAWWEFDNGNRPGSGWDVGTHYTELWAQDHDGLRDGHWQRKSGNIEDVFRANQWNFIAVTYDGYRLIEYINGDSEGHVFQEQSSWIRHANGPLGDAHNERLAIGGWPLWGFYLHGRIDEVRIYDRALTSEQLDAIYQDADIVTVSKGGGAPPARAVRGFVDSDGDLLMDDKEDVLETDRNNSDTDGDRLKDGYEVAVYGTDPLSADSDNDGLTDTEEIFNETYKRLDPNNPDTDNDGLLDGVEISNNLNPLLNDANDDNDNDGLTNIEEIGLSTDPNNSDTDNDLLTDADEINIYFTDPLNPDTDNDSLTDGDEVFRFFTSPIVAQQELFNENYEIYPPGINPGDSPDSYWIVFGHELQPTPSIQGDTQNQWLNIPFSSSSGNVPPAWASFGIVQKDSAPWKIGKDFTNAVIQFDIRSSNLSEPIPDVIAVQMMEQDNVFDFRVPDENLEVVPASSEGWVTVTFSINDVSYSERWWEYLERTKVTKVNIVFMQTVNNFVATGSVDIDNFRVLLPQKHKIRGFVLDINGNGVKNVDVNLKDNEGNLVYSISGNPDDTNRNGRYRFLDIPFGSYIIEPVANDNALSFTPSSQTLIIPDRTSKTFRIDDFEAELAPAKHKISGYIKNIMDEGVKNVEVQLRDNTGELVVLTENPVTTKKSGKYQFIDVLNGEYTVVPVPNDKISGYSPDNDTVLLDGFYPVTLESNFTAYLAPITHNVRGYVFDFSGNPLPDAEVALLDESGNLVSSAAYNPAQANNRGRYVFHDVPDGIYYLKAKSGYEIFDPYRERLELTPFVPVKINLDFNAVFSNSESVSSLDYIHANGSAVNFDNKVYVIGAYNDYSGASKVELFDPRTDTWTSKQDMPEPRYNFGSFVLDKKIYCVGGQNWGSVEKSVLRYDIESDTWSTLNNLPVQMFNAECAVAGGKAYIILGQQKIYDNPPEIDFNIPVTYMYDNDNDLWIEKSPMPVPVEQAAVQSYDGKIYVLGGLHQDVYGTHIYRTDMQIYDPENDAWTAGTAVPDGIYQYQSNSSYTLESVLYGSKIYLFSFAVDIQTGDVHGLNPNVYVYSINEDSWESYSLSDYLPLDSVRVGICNGIGLVGEYAYFVFNDTLAGERINDVYRFNLIDMGTTYDEQVSSYNYIHANGGVLSDDDNDALYVISSYIYDSGSGKIEVYNPDTDIWTILADMPEPRYNFGSFLLDKDIYCVGGQYSGDVRNSVLKYSTIDNTWSVKNNLPVRMFNAESAVVDGTAYIVAGQRNIYNSPFNIPATYMYDHENDVWVEKAPLPLPVEQACVETYRGEIYVFGGLHQDVYGTHIYRTDVQIYDPQADSWSLGTPVPEGFYFSGLNSSYIMRSVLYDGKAFLFPYQASSPQGLYRFVFVYDFDTDKWAKYDLSKFLPLNMVKLAVQGGLGMINGYCYFVFNYDLQFHKIRDVYRFHLSNLISKDFHPADSDRNWRISSDEIMDYNQAWRDGLTWGFLGEIIDINYLTRAGYLSVTSERYKFDDSKEKPACWQPVE